MPTEKKKDKEELKELNFIESIKLVTGYLIDDMKRGPLQFKIAVFTIFIIVAFMAILLNANSITTTMFLSLAERQTGDTDFVITAQFSTTGTDISDENTENILDSFPLLNITEVSESLSKVGSISGASGRWLFPGRLYNIENGSLSTSTFAVVGDSLMERSLGLGRALTGVEPLKNNECIVMRRTADVIKMRNENKTVRFNIDVIKFLGQNNFNAGSEDEITDLILNQIPETVVINTADFNETLFGPEDEPNTVEEEEVPDFINATELNNFIEGVNNGSINLFNGAENITLNTSDIKEILRESIADALNFSIDLEAKYVIDSPQGKWPENLGNVVFFETKYFFEYISEYLSETLAEVSVNIQQNITAGTEGGELFATTIAESIEAQLVEPIRQGFEDLRLEEQTLSMNAVVEDKAGVYNSFNKYDERLVKISNDMMEALGDSSKYTMTAPLLIGFEFLGYLSMFIDGLIYAILIILAILSYILISSLMIFNIDEKTYEFGMLRALGLKRQNLVYMLFIQGFFYSVAGWSVGVVTSFVASSFIKYIFYLNARVKIGVTMEMIAWIATIFFGFATPIFTNFTSIKKSLGNNLKDSLDLYRRSVNQMTIIFVKLAKLGISRTTFILAVQLSVYGFLFYYVAPLSFFFNRIDIFLLLLNLVFLGMILGLTVMANLLQPYAEQLMLVICHLFMWKNKSLKVVIEKNLQSHAPRNMKTALMITMSVCFIIFCGSGIRMNALGIVNQLVATQGGDLVLVRNVRKEGVYGFDQSQISQFLDEYKERFPGRIKEYCWSTKSLVGFPYVYSTILTPLSLYPEIEALITGVNSTVMDSVATELYVPNSYQEGINYPELSTGVQDGVSSIFDGELELIEEPYDKEAVLSLNLYREQRQVRVRNVKAVLPSGFTPETGISVDTPCILAINSIETTYAKINITHTANKVPGFSFSRYINQLFNHDILISLEAYKTLLGDIKEIIEVHDNPQVTESFYQYETEAVKNSKDQLPYNKLQVKLESGITTLQKDEIINGMKTFIGDTDFIIDTIEIKSQTESSLSYLSILNAIISFLTTLISFFMLLISLIKNIKDNVWELGILRSMGLNHRQVFLIYFVETFSVIFSALVLGTIVGLLVALSGTTYYVIFFELPFNMYFPFFEFFLLLGFLTLTSFLTTWVGLKGIVYQPIAKILKGLL